MRCKPLYMYAFMGLFLTTTHSVHALPSDIKQPLKLSADKATYNDKTGKTEYSGRVVISQGTLKIEADLLSIDLTKKGGISAALATGKPAYMQQKVSAQKGYAKGQANRISYNAKTGIVTLTGNASLNQGGTSIKSNVIRYSLKAGDFEAKGSKKQRVELVIPPNANAKGLSIR